MKIQFKVRQLLLDWAETDRFDRVGAGTKQHAP